MDVTPSSSYMSRHDQNGEEEGGGIYILILVGNKLIWRGDPKQSGY